MNSVDGYLDGDFFQLSQAAHEASLSLVVLPDRVVDDAIENSNKKIIGQPRMSDHVLEACLPYPTLPPHSSDQDSSSSVSDSAENHVSSIAAAEVATPICSTNSSMSNPGTALPTSALPPASVPPTSTASPTPSRSWTDVPFSALTKKACDARRRKHGRPTKYMATIPLDPRTFCHNRGDRTCVAKTRQEYHAKCPDCGGTYCGPCYDPIRGLTEYTPGRQMKRLRQNSKISPSKASGVSKEPGGSAEEVGVPVEREDIARVDEKEKDVAQKPTMPGMSSHRWRFSKANERAQHREDA